MEVGGRLGPGLNDDKEAAMFNRVIRWQGVALEYGKGPRQADKLVYELGLEGAKSVVTPGAKTTRKQVEKDQ